MFFGQSIFGAHQQIPSGKIVDLPDLDSLMYVVGWSLCFLHSESDSTLSKLTFKIFISIPIA